MPTSFRASLTAFGVALLSTSLTFLVTLLLALPYSRESFLLLVPAVVLTAWYGGRWPALLAAVLSALVTAYWLAQSGPASIYTLGEELIYFATFAAIAVLVSWLTSTRRQAERQLRLTLASIGDAVIATERDGRISLMNGVAERLTGWSLEQAKGEPLPQVFRIVNEQTRRPVENPYDKIIRTGVVVGLANHTILVSRDGREIPIDDSGAPIRDATGRITGTVLVFRDISERKESDEILARLAAIVESSEDAIIGKTLDGIVVSWNRGAERMFGYTESEMAGRSLSILTPPDRSDDLPSIMERLKRGESIAQYETTRMLKDGRVIDVALTISPVLNADGQIIGASTIARDITQRKRAERARQFLVEATQRLATTLDPDAAAAILAGLIVPDLADSCSVVLVDADDQPYLAASAHADPAKAKLIPIVWQRFFVTMHGENGRPAVMGTQLAEFVSAAPPLGADPFGDAEFWQMVTELNPTSYIRLPLVARGKSIGSLTLTVSTGRRPLDQEDFAQAQELARRAALALDNAALYHAERMARQTADRTVSNLMAIQQVTAALSRAIMPDQVAQVVLQQGLNALGAAAGMIAGLDATAGQLVTLGMLGYSTATAQGFRSFSLQAPFPLSEAVRTGEMLVLEERAESMSRFPLMADQMRSAGFGSLVCLPLLIESRPVGGLSLSFAQERHFTQPEHDLMQTLAQLTAHALERARLYEAEQLAHAQAENARQEAVRAQDRLALLAQAGTVLSSSLDYRTTLSQLARLVVPRYADWCTVHIAVEGGPPQQLEVAHVDPAKLALVSELNHRYPPDPNAPGGVRAVIETGRSEYAASIPEQLLLAAARDAEHARLIMALGLRSYLIVPLLARERVLGAITLVWAESEKQYGPADVEFIEELAQRAALAIDNARLYDSAQQSNAELERRVAERTAELRKLSAHLQTAREEERAGIARELHDELAQILIVAKLDIDRLAKQSQRTDAVAPAPQMQAGLQSLARTIDESVQSIRAIVSELRPPMLDNLGLEAALSWQVQQFQERSGIQATFSADAAGLDWGPDRGLAIFRILQESLNNVLRHAHATHVEVSLRAQAGQLVLTVADNGRGVSAEDMQKPDHFGIRGMQERIGLLGGDFQIQGVPARGTTVTVRAPLKVVV